MSTETTSPSPYVVGAAIGTLSTFAFATAKRGLGITTPIESLTALAVRRAAPDALDVNAYVQLREEKPKIDWETFLIAGVFCGSLLASRHALRRKENAPQEREPDARGTNRLARHANATLGGALMMFGARMAKGCTSGHGITGMLQLALSSWVFTPVMFASAAVCAHALQGKGEHHGR